MNARRFIRAPRLPAKLLAGTGALALSASLLSFPASAQVLFSMPGGGGEYRMSLKTFADRRYTGVIRQKFDFSCGSAAVATLLTYHYGNSVDEMSILEAMYARGNQEKIRREGFSLLDMKQFLESVGYQAEGYRESLDRLAKVGIPAIVLINKKGYLHFVVVKGIDKERVAVGDPTRGVQLYSRKEFEKMWNGVLFVVLDDMKVARKNFNTVSAWRPYGLPEFRNMLDNGQLGTITMATNYSPGYF